MKVCHFLEFGVKIVVPTVKLYENDSYIKTFDAMVLSCEEKDNKYLITLDKTAFFPEGGGQYADKGILADANVLDVQIKDGIIYHLTDKPLNMGDTITGEIDWDTRFSRMQNHTGEHIVSGVIHNLYGYNNVGFHLSDSVVTLDTDGPLNEQDIAKIELEVNKVIYANKKINVIYPNADELSNYDYRSKLDITENVRLVQIEDTDLCACCAPHVAFTGEVGIVKIISFIPYKKGTRIEMVAGLLALQDYSMLHNANKQTMNLLCTKREEIFSMVQKIHKDLGNIKAENKKMSSELALLKMEKTSIGNGVCAFIENGTYDELRFCSNSLIKENEYCCVFSKTENAGFIYVVASENKNIKDIVLFLNSTFNGRGGGKDFYAQGTINATKEEIVNKLLERASL